MSIEGLPPLREIIAFHKLSAQKKLGQNFIFDLNITLKIARLAGDLTQDTVVEIGPGPGGLTRAILLLGARKVIAIERDPRFIEALQPLIQASENRLMMQEGDALKIPLKDLGSGPFKIIANLPYNIATPLLIGWLKEANLISSLTLMFQKEVAERIVAVPFSKAYGRLAVICQSQAKCTKLFDIAASSFIPSPKVSSSVVHLIPYKPCHSLAHFEALEKLTQAAFGQRRKMLKSSLKAIFLHPEEILSMLKIDAKKRAEELEVKDFTTLSQYLIK